MGTWGRSALKMSGAELEVQEALVALRRVLESGEIRATTRVILEGAVRALKAERPEPTPG